MERHYNFYRSETHPPGYIYIYKEIKGGSKPSSPLAGFRSRWRKQGVGNCCCAGICVFRLDDGADESRVKRQSVRFEACGVYLIVSVCLRESDEVFDARVSP